MKCRLCFKEKKIVLGMIGSTHGFCQDCIDAYPEVFGCLLERDFFKNLERLYHEKIEQLKNKLEESNG